MSLRSLLLTGSSILLLVAVAACDTQLAKQNPYDPDLPEHQKEPATLSGQIELEVGVAASATVEVRPAGKSTTPEEDGSFLISDISPGTYSVVVSAPGHSTWTQGGVYCGVGQRVDLGRIGLLAARGSMQGSVVLKLDPDNDAGTHGGALVHAHAVFEGRLAAGDAGQSSVTNPDGSWTMTGMPVGTYQLNGSKDGYAPSPPIEVMVTEDEMAPVADMVLRSITGVIEIDGGEVYTNDSEGDVMVTVLAFETDEMQISEDPEFPDEEWEQHNAQREWRLSAGNGEKTVFMRFRNGETYETPLVYDTIVLDTEPPTVASVQIAGNADHVTGAQVALTLRAEDTLSGVASMRTALQGEDILAQPWVDFTYQLVVELPVGPDPDGVESTVQAQFRDGAGNPSDVVADAVVVDSVAPQNASLVIEHGAARTASRDVMLTLTAEGAREMKVSNDSGLLDAEWQPFSPSLGWRLTENDEQKTVYARFRDPAGNLTTIVEDSIELNTRGNLSGRFLLEGAAADGNADITVSLRSDPPLTVPTQPDGSFALLDVAVGAYSLEASKDGYRTAELPYLEVEPGGSLVLEPRTLSMLRGSLTGSATRQGAGSEKHGGILVEVQGSGRSTVTNSAGEWTVDSLPVAQYAVRASAAGYETATASDVTVVADTATVVPPLVLAPDPGSITGSVTLEGLTAPDLGIAEIVVAGQTVFCEDDGGFEVLDVLAGTYVLLARAPGYGPVEKLVTVQPGAELALTDPIALRIARGHLVGAAELENETDHSGIVIAVQGTGRSAVTLETGEWTIRDVPVGQYTITASALGFHDAQATDITVVAEDETAVPLLTLLANPGSVTGVVELEGVAAGLWDGTLVTIEGTGLSETTAGDGSFTFNSVPAGTYPLTARTVGYAAEQTTVIVLPGELADPVLLTLAIARGEIAGTATLAGETDHSGITVEVDGQGYAGVTVNDGTYRIRDVPVGTYTLTARKEDYTSRPVGAVTVVEDQTVIAAAVELVRQRGDFEILERATDEQEYINDPAVKLEFTVIPPDAADIWIAEDPGFTTGVWEVFTGPEHDYDLLGVDGVINVFAKFRDTLEVESSEFTASTVLDRAPPLDTSSVLIDDGTDYSTSPIGEVTLTLDGRDETSGIGWVQISTDGAFDTEGDDAYSPTISTPVDGPLTDGLKTVWVKFVDRAGNRSVLPVSDAIYLDRAVPVDPALQINGGATFATGALVTLTLFARDVCTVGYPTGACDAGYAEPAQMMVSNDQGFQGALWEAYAVDRSWFLKPGDGERNVYVKFRDGAGNDSPQISAGIIVDGTPPGSPQVTIQGGEVTGTRNVTLSLSANPEPAEMMVAEGGDFSAAVWQTFASTRAFTLSVGDGLKTVAAKFRDAAGNESLVAADTTTLDTAAPGGSLSILEGDFVALPGVTLALTASPDATRVCVYGDVDSACDPLTDPLTWAAFSSTLAADLTAGDGAKTARVVLADAAANKGTELAAATVLDALAPSGLALSIAGVGPAGHTRSAAVTLSLAATDATSGVSEMMVSESSTFVGADYEPFVTARAWTIGGADGTNTVYLRVRDRAGNFDDASGTIELDRGLPSIDSLSATGDSGEPAGYSLDDSVLLSFTASDGLALPQDLDYCLDNSPTFDNPTCADLPASGSVIDLAWTLAAGDGQRLVYLKITDPAGNETISSIALTVDGTAPTGAALSIEEDAADPIPDNGYTHRSAVVLHPQASGATSMCITGDVAAAVDCGVPANWIAYSESVATTLTAGDGAKQADVRFRDAAGNETAPISASIVFDGTLPGGLGVTIAGEGPAGYTRDVGVSLTLAAADATSGVYQMMLANDALFTGAEWQPFSGGAAWTLPGPDGDNTVYFKVRDRAGNEAGATSSIVLDRAAPTISSLMINGGAAYTASADVSLDLVADDTLTVKADLFLCLANEPNFVAPDCAAVPDLTGYAWTLAAGDGDKTVYARVTDEAGHVSERSAAILLDSEAPTGGTLVIDGGEYTNAANVNLSLSAAGAAEMCLYGDITSPCDELIDAHWSPFGTSASVVLNGGDGLNTVRVKYRDAAKNVTGEAWDTVTLDGTDPSVTVTVLGTGPSGFSRTADVTLQISASDATSGVAEMMVTDAACGGGSWEGLASVRSWTLPGPDGGQTVCVRVRDRAGNTGDGNGVVILDRQAPTFTAVLTLAGNNGEPIGYSGDAEVDLGFTVWDDVDAADDLDYWLANDPSFSGAMRTDVPAGGAVATTWTLLTGEGARTAFAKITDQAGNEVTGSASIVVDSEAPMGGGLSIIDADSIPDNGYTNATSVTVSTPAAGASDRCVYGDLVGAVVCTWEGSYSPSALVDLDTATNGTKTINVQYRDAAGNVAGPYAATIEYDGTDPGTASVSIDGGASHVSEAVVTLTLAASDAGSGIVQMRLANGAVPSGDWEPYSTGRSWTLAAGADGNRDVTVQFRDRAGNMASDTASTTLDTGDPTITTFSAVGNDGEPAGFTHDTAIDVTLTATDVSDGTELDYCVANNASFDGAQCGDLAAGMPHTIAIADWTLGTGDGTKTLHARVWDRAGNETLDTVEIVLDSEGPTGGAISLTEDALDPIPGNGYTNVAAITANTPVSGATDRCVYGDLVGAAACVWEGSYAETRAVTLTAGNGTKTVNVQYRDAAGHVAGPYSTTIEYDGTNPSSASVLIDGSAAGGYVDDDVVTLTLSSSDADSGILEMRVANGVAAGGDWEPYSTGRSWILAVGANGNRDVTVQFRDRAGNTLSDTASTTLDTAAPSLTSLTVTGDGGEPAGYSNDSTVTVTVDGTDVIAPASVNACVANNAGFDDANCGLLVAGTRTINSFDLGAGEGAKVVYARLTDLAGNTVLDTAGIVVDGEAPVGASITLEELAPDPILGNGYTDQTTVTAHLTVVGATEQCVYLDGIGSCSWESPVTATKTVTVSTGGAGMKTVKAEFRDAAGLTVGPVQAQVYYDNTDPPVPTLLIDGSASGGYVDDEVVTLTIAATDADSGILQMRAANGGSAAAADWEGYSTGRSWTLDAGADGGKQVTLEVMDRAGNTRSVTASTTLDRAAPSVTGLTVTGNGGEPAGYSYDSTVNVTVDGTDVIAPANVTACVASNAGFDDADCGLLVAGTRTVLGFDLGPGDATKVVYVRLTDPAGNQALDTATIEVDSENPSGAGITLEELAPDPLLGNGYTNQGTVTAHLAVAGASEQCVYLDGIGSCSWESPVTATKDVTVSTGGAGMKTVKAEFRDAAGHTVGPVSAQVYYDATNPPVPTLLIDGSASGGYVDDEVVTLTITATDADSGIYQMRVANGGSAAAAPWEAYTTGRSWTLDAGADGGKQVTIDVRDYAGNPRSVIASTTLDRAAPTFTSLTAVGNNGAGEPAGYSYDNTVDVTIVGTDVISPANVTACVANNASFDNADCGLLVAGTRVISGFDLGAGDGSKVAYARLTDPAGNQALDTQGIVVDSEAPSPSQVTLTEDALDPIPGNGYTNQTSITVNTPASGAAQMCITGDIASAPNCVGVGWEAHLQSKVVSLEAPNGSKTIQVYYRDAAMHQVGPYEAAVYFDVTDPDLADVEIEESADWAGYVNNPNVNLALDAHDDGSGILEMRIANGATSGGDWQPYATGAFWTLAVGIDGNRSVTVEFRDRAGNTDDDTATVFLDTTAPTSIGVALNSGAEYVNDRNVTLDTDATNADEMCVYELEGGSGCVWMPYANSLAFALTDFDGLKTIYAEYRDFAGNVAGPTTTQVYLDRLPPYNEFVEIDGGAVATASTTVTLSLFAEDDTLGATEMRIDNTPLMANPWIPYATSKLWTLSPGDGVKAVFAQFRDVADNQGSVVTDDIVLDTVGPFPVTVVATGNDGEPGGYSKDDSVTVTVTATDGMFPDTMQACVANDASFDGAVCGLMLPAGPMIYEFVTDPFMLFQGDGLRTVYARVTDELGNATEASANITVDSLPPENPTATIEENDSRPDNGYTNDLDVTIHLSASGADAYCIMGMVDVAPPPNCNDPLDPNWLSPVPASVNVTLVDLAGPHGLEVHYRDVAGNPVFVPAFGTDTGMDLVYDHANPGLCDLFITGTTLDLADTPQDDVATTIYTDVRLTLSMDDADSPITQFKVSNDWAFGGATWREYIIPEVESWLLPGGAADGEPRTTYLRCRDAADNYSDTSDGIILDNVGPAAPSVAIDAGAQYTTDIEVELTLTAEVGTPFARWATTPLIGGVWQPAPWGPPKPLVDLMTTDEWNTVYAEFRDNAGNRSALVSDTIFWDNTNPMPPVNPVTPGNFVVADNTYYVDTLTPTLSWEPSPSTDVDHYTVTLTRDPFGLNIITSYNTSSLSFGTPALTEDLYWWNVKAVDAAGRESGVVNGGDFFCDVTPPSTPRFASVANWVQNLADHPVTCSADNLIPIDLAVTSTDGEGNFDTYEISGGHTIAGAQPCAPLWDYTDAQPYVFDADTINFFLLENTEDTLRVRGRDKAGNISSEDFIVMAEDSNPPTNPVLAALPYSESGGTYYLNDNSVTVNIGVHSVDAEDHFDRYESCRCAAAPCDGPGECLDAGGTWIESASPASVTFDLSGLQDQASILLVRGCDLADNCSAPDVAADGVSIVEDSTPPSAPSIAPGMRVVNARSANIFVTEFSTDNFLLDRYQVYGGLNTEWTDLPSGATVAEVPLVPDRENVIQVRGVDMAGNVGTASFPSEITEVSTLKITPEPTTSALRPRCFGDRAVWYETSGGALRVGIQMLDLATMTEHYLANTTSDRYPDIHRDFVVWENTGGGGQLMMQNLRLPLASGPHNLGAGIRRPVVTMNWTTGAAGANDVVTAFQTTTGRTTAMIEYCDISVCLDAPCAVSCPATGVAVTTAGNFAARIAGDKIIYSDDRGNPNEDLEMYTLGQPVDSGQKVNQSGLPTNISPFPNDPGYDIWNNLIVWTENVVIGDAAVVLRDTGLGAPVKIEQEDSVLWPAIFGDHVVWYDARQGNQDIYHLDMTGSGEESLVQEASDQVRPDVCGHRVVWQDPRTDMADTNNIYMADVSSERWVTINSSKQQRPEIWNDRIVYQDDRGASYNIWMFERNVGETVLVSGSGDQITPDIWDQYMVYRDQVGVSDHIYLCDVTDCENTKLQVDTDTGRTEPGGVTRSEPRIFGDTIVWRDNRIAGEFHLYTATYTTGPLAVNPDVRITNAGVSGTSAQYPQITDGGRIVFVNMGLDATGDIWLYDPAALCGGAECFVKGADATRQGYPDVYWDASTYRIVYEEGLDGTGKEIYMMEPGADGNFGTADDVETMIAGTPGYYVGSFDHNWPRIWNDWVVWSDERNVGSINVNDIFLYDIESRAEYRITPLTLGSYKAYYPMVHGHDVVWQDDRMGWDQNYDIYWWTPDTD